MNKKIILSIFSVTVFISLLLILFTFFPPTFFTKYLVKKKYNVVVFDNNSRGRSRRIKDVNNKISFIKGDIRDKKKLLSINKKIDTIIHLAYINGTKFFYKKPFEILDIAVNGYLNILEFCKIKKVQNLFLAYKQYYE